MFCRWLAGILSRVQFWLSGPAEDEPLCRELVASDFRPGMARPIETRYTATAARGLMLLCSGPAGEMRLLQEGDVADRLHFWRLWKALGGMKQGIREEGDSEPYDPCPEV